MRHETVRKRHEITVTRDETVRKRHEITVTRHETVRKRHEITVTRDETVRKRHEITVTRHETVRKRHEITVTRREITVSSFKSSSFLIKLDGNETVEEECAVQIKLPSKAYARLPSGLCLSQTQLHFESKPDFSR